MVVLLTLMILAAGLASPAGAATRIDLDGQWRFRTDPDGTGETKRWFGQPPQSTREVTVPHTWNIGADQNYLGAAWYFRRFDMPVGASGTHVQLHFGATFYSAKVWLNGVQVGSHEGGFTAYALDISSHLKPRNLLAIRIDNRPGAETIPGFARRGAPQAWYDWWTYGGIVRDVWLSQTGPLWIERQRIRCTLTPELASISDRVVVRSSKAAKTAITLRLTARDAQGLPAARRSVQVQISAGTTEVPLSLPIDRPQLWNLDQPNLYRMDAEVVDDRGLVLDEHSADFGLRTIEIRDRHLLLNGERVRLTGLTRHEDSPWEGLAETAGTMRYDYGDLKALHTTLSRPVHYPQNPFILDYADRHGILLIPEIPVWQFDEQQLADPKVQALARQQLRELIEQDGSHPSIFAWSVANESATGTPGGIAYFRAMRDWIRAFDPDRFVSYADDNLPKLERADQSAANDADFLMMNEYFGSWHGPASELAPALDRVNALFPGKMVIISEFGYAGIFSRSPQEADRARIRILQEQLPVLAARDWIGGAILWCYQDYRSHRNLWPGAAEGYVEHGVVDEARQRKPSYDVWRALTAPAHVDAQWIHADGPGALAFEATITPNPVTSLPHYPLREYRLVWNVLNDKGEAVGSGTRRLESLAGPVRIEAKVDSDQGQMRSRLFLRLAESGVTGF